MINRRKLIFKIKISRNRKKIFHASKELWKKKIIFQFNLKKNRKNRIYTSMISFSYALEENFKKL